MIWNAALIVGGHWLADVFAEAQSVLGWIIVGTVIVSVLAYIWRVATWKPRVRD
jgi:membrane protein DedA with SNARE-associated domain